MAPLMKLSFYVASLLYAACHMYFCKRLNNVLKTKGYHVEHNFGHGQQYLAAMMCSLNLLAFLFHTVLEWSDDKYALLRRVLARRQTFVDDILALTRYLVFDSWDHLIDFMLRGLELQSSLDTG